MLEGGSTAWVPHVCRKRPAWLLGRMGPASRMGSLVGAHSGLQDTMWPGQGWEVHCPTELRG